MADILRARVPAIACGYPDADDLDDLRTDPAFRLAWADIIHERGPDTPDTQPDDQKVRQDDRTTRPDGHARKLEALRSEIEANLPP